MIAKSPEVAILSIDSRMSFSNKLVGLLDIDQFRLNEFHRLGGDRPA